MTKSILLVGVGGQGTITASKLLTIGLMEAGYDIKMSEIHGMSQRGGSVSSQVRYGDKVFSPVIEVGGADIIVSFEKMEALRWLDHLKIGGKVLVAETEINPMPVLNGKAEYAKDVLEFTKKLADVTSFDAMNMAKDLGNEKCMNVILLGALVKSMGLEEINWESIIESNVKEKFVELNKKALKFGMDLVK